MADDKNPKFETIDVEAAKEWVLSAATEEEALARSEKYFLHHYGAIDREIAEATKEIVATRERLLKLNGKVAAARQKKRPLSLADAFLQEEIVKRFHRAA